MAQALGDSPILSSALCLCFIFSLDSSRWQGGKGSPFSVQCGGTVAQDKRDERLSVPNTRDDKFIATEIIHISVNTSTLTKILISMFNLERASLEHTTRQEWPSPCPGIEQAY